MTRLPDWEKRLNEAVERHMALPSEYGVSDCYRIAEDAYEAVTGGQLYGKVKYSNEAGIAKQLRKRGFETMRDALAAKLEEIPPLMAQRGDLGVVERDGVISAGVVTSIGFVTRGEGAVLFLPITDLKAAFRVGE